MKEINTKELPLLNPRQTEFQLSLSIAEASPNGESQFLSSNTAK